LFSLLYLHQLIEFTTTTCATAIACITTELFIVAASLAPENQSTTPQILSDPGGE
jgi:hypothetical protein